MNQMTRWVYANCRFASLDVGERAAKVVEAAFAKAFGQLSGGKKTVVAMDMINLAVEVIQGDPEWQNLIARANALKAAGGDLAPYDIASLFKPVEEAIMKAAALYGINANEVKKRLSASLGLPDVLVPQKIEPKRPKKQLSFEEWKALRRNPTI